MNVEKMEEALVRFIKLMDLNDLSELELEDEGTRIRLKKGGEVVPSPATTIGTKMENAGGESSATAALESGRREADKDSGLIEIPSPLVGTFYRAPSPDTPVFVEAGDHVDTETVLCIVEAMKVMNEIKSEVEGTIVDILVENGQSVEYGQPLFLIEPAG